MLLFQDSTEYAGALIKQGWFTEGLQILQVTEQFYRSYREKKEMILITSAHPSLNNSKKNLIYGLISNLVKKFIYNMETGNW